MRSVVDFLSALASNNNREWFAAHKAEYRQAEAQFGEFALGVIDGIAAFDDSVRGLGLRDCTYRIYRDTRFSADKTPYKTNMGVFVAPHGKKAGYAGYYLHIEPSAESFLWAGSHMPSPVVLRSIREEIIDNGEAIERAIAGSHGFELCRDRSLQRNPKGFPAGNRYDEWLRPLDFGNQFKRAGHRQEAFLSGNLRKLRIDAARLLVFVVLRAAQQPRRHPGRVFHRVAAVDVDAFALAGRQMLEEQLRVLLLLLCGKAEDALHAMQARAPGHTRREGVAVSRLALAGKRAHQVFPGLALFEFHTKSLPAGRLPTGRDSIHLFPPRQSFRFGALPSSPLFQCLRHRLI